MKLTVLFNGQFWEGIVEIDCCGHFKAIRYIFGAEPQDAEVLEFIVSNRILQLLDKANATVSVDLCDRKPINPKRQARKIAKEMALPTVSTMAQEAIKQDFELRKKQAKTISKAAKEREKERKRSIARQKAKLRHKGKA